MAQNKKFKWDIRKIVLAILLVAVVIGIATGKISLANLLGITPQTDQATWSGEITTAVQTTEEETQIGLPTAPHVIPSSMETIDLTMIDVTATPTKIDPIKPTETKAPQTETKTPQTSKDDEDKEYYFRYKSYLDEHYEKHGIEMGFPDANAYRKAASDIINAAGTEGVLSKYKSDGSKDQCFYVEATKEFVVLSYDGYIRTYFICSGLKYFEKQ